MFMQFERIRICRIYGAAWWLRFADHCRHKLLIPPGLSCNDISGKKSNKRLTLVIKRYKACLLLYLVLNLQPPSLFHDLEI